MCSSVWQSVIKKKLPSSSSIFTVELCAAFNSLKCILMASLKKLMPSHHLVQEVQDWLVLLHSRMWIRVSFCWVPAHVALMGTNKLILLLRKQLGFIAPSVSISHIAITGGLSAPTPEIIGRSIGML